MSRLAEALQQAERMGDDGTSADQVTVIEQPRPDRSIPAVGGAAETAGHGFVKRPDGKLVVASAVPPAAVEQFRRLAATLHHARLEKNTRIVMVTSASAGEGKTLTSTNLALTLSESYRRNVLLIDADLRQPRVHQLLNIPNVFGLSDGLKSQTDEKLSLIQVSEYLTVLPAGRPDRDPISGLASPRMRRIVEEAAMRFDWVIIDTPPVGFLSDARLLVAMVDVALFVVRSGKSPYRLIQRALEAIGRDRVLGVVLNAVDEEVDIGSYLYYGYYNTSEAQGARR